MLKVFFPFFFIIVFSFSSAQQRVVQKNHADGSVHVVYYYEKSFLKDVLVKQEIYFENGNLEYSGEWKHGQEHGEWIYYHPNGMKRAHEYWRYGKETGKWKEYDETGKLLKTIEYKSGKIIKETDY
jgi:antitoxin component YwqK of YwqJK toxin-antitoxin module